MFGLVVRFDLRPGAEDGFDRLAAETLAGIKGSEPGTLLYLCHVVDGSPHARVFYELYRDRAAFDEHEGQPHVKRFLAEREQFIANTRVEFLGPTDGKGLPH